MSEHAEQAALIEWAANVCPRVPELALLYAIPNGGHRTKGTAGRMKAEGTKAGVPDLCLPVARGGHHGLYVEMKVKGGAVSDKQKHWIARLRDQGYRVEVCWSTEAAARALEDYLGVPPSERTLFYGREVVTP